MSDDEHERLRAELEALREQQEKDRESRTDWIIIGAVVALIVLGALWGSNSDTHGSDEGPCYSRTGATDC